MKYCWMDLLSNDTQSGSNVVSFPKQGILPPDYKNQVYELFVSPDKVQTVKVEASTLPQLHINKLDLQWVQVRHYNSCCYY